MIDAALAVTNGDYFAIRIDHQVKLTDCFQLSQTLPSELIFNSAATAFIDVIVAGSIMVNLDGAEAHQQVDRFRANPALLQSFFCVLGKVCCRRPKIDPLIEVTPIQN